MRAEDGTVLFAQLLGDGVTVAFHVGRDGSNGLGQSLQFGSYHLARNESARDAESFRVDNQRLTDGHTGRSGDPL